MTAPSRDPRERPLPAGVEVRYVDADVDADPSIGPAVARLHARLLTITAGRAGTVPGTYPKAMVGAWYGVTGRAAGKWLDGLERAGIGGIVADEGRGLMLWVGRHPGAALRRAETDAQISLPGIARADESAHKGPLADESARKGPLARPDVLPLREAQVDGAPAPQSGADDRAHKCPPQHACMHADDDPLDHHQQHHPRADGAAAPDVDELLRAVDGLLLDDARKVVAWLDAGWLGQRDVRAAMRGTRRKADAGQAPRPAKYFFGAMRRQAQARERDWDHDQPTAAGHRPGDRAPVAPARAAPGCDECGDVPRAGSSVYCARCLALPAAERKAQADAGDPHAGHCARCDAPAAGLLCEACMASATRRDPR